MTRKKRIILFLICLFLFLLIAPAAVFYSEGYRIDLQKKKVTQTGAFYFKVWPKSVQIYLDGKLKKKTDIFFGAALLDNLLPQKYRVEIKKEGFHVWEKTLEIEEKQVSDAKNIILIPENPIFDILAKNKGGFFFSPDGKKIILKEVNGKDWNFSVFDPEKNLNNYLIDSKEFLAAELFKFSPDSKRALLKADSGKSQKYLLVDLSDNPAETISSLDFLGDQIQDIFFNPENPDKLFLLKNGVFSEADVAGQEISLPLLNNVLACQISDRKIYYLNDSGFLFEADFSFVPRRLNKVPYPLEKESKFKIHIASDKIFLQDNGKLMLFNSGSNAFEKFFETEKELKISPDLKKIVYFSDYEIWIGFLGPELGQPRKSEGEKVFIARFSEKIGDVFWYTAHYLIFNVGSKIKIAEIDDRDKINIIDLAAFDNSKIFWNQPSKELYILSNGNLYKSEKLIK